MPQRSRMPRVAGPKNMGCLRAIVRGKVGAGPTLTVERRGIGLAWPVEGQQVAKLDRDLLAALDKLDFNITDDNVDCAR